MILSLLTTLIISTVKLKPGIPATTPAKNITVINGNVSVDKTLPEKFYGEWKVASEVIATTDSEYWGIIGLDRWIFARSENQVTITNPETGAISSIIVNQVVGNKARFTKKNKEVNENLSEIIEISIQGDRFSGTLTKNIKFFRGNEIYKTDVVKYRVVGQKINGSTMKEMFAK